ncbi:Glia maturation factor gamma [Liparis tanakae]|uniref:Glia maturation factor gamma n=1 Tax=Liparis tanakae TaxID=230148 RepID=A0A4Z2I622_9TELE|nr:Glia maturation factor gamma [Liparis tanakae]
MKGTVRAKRGQGPEPQRSWAIHLSPDVDASRMWISVQSASQCSRQMCKKRAWVRDTLFRRDNSATVCSHSFQPLNQSVRIPTWSRNIMACLLGKENGNSSSLVVCEVDESLKAKLKKFRFRKETNNAAILNSLPEFSASLPLPFSLSSPGENN